MANQPTTETTRKEDSYATTTSTTTTEEELVEDVENKDDESEGVALCGACKKRPVGNIYKPYRGAQGYVRLLPCRCHICKNCMIDFLSTVVVLTSTTDASNSCHPSSSFPCGCPLCSSNTKQQASDGSSGGGLIGYVIVEGGVTVHRQDYSSTQSKMTAFQRRFKSEGDATSTAGASKPPPLAAAPFPAHRYGPPPEHQNHQPFPLPPLPHAAAGFDPPRKMTATVATQTVGTDEDGQSLFGNDQSDNRRKRKRTGEESNVAQPPGNGKASSSLLPSFTTHMSPLAAAAAKATLVPQLAAAAAKADRTHKTFEQRLAELAAFKAEHGHCNVPPSANESLSNWVRMVRKRKVARKEYQVQLLNEIGFDWEHKRIKDDRDWKQRFEQLKQFKKDHGHCRVPWKYPANQSLAEWVHTQRRLHTTDKLRADREDLLESVDFTWSKSPDKSVAEPARAGGRTQPVAESNHKSLASSRKPATKGNSRPLPRAGVAVLPPTEEYDDDEDDDSEDEDGFEPYIHEDRRLQFGFF